MTDIAYLEEQKEDPDGACIIPADGDGRYRFRSIKPGAYPSDPGKFRTPHIHFEITSKVQKRVTQMYFQGERLNDADEILSVLKKAGSDKSVIAHLAPPLAGHASDLAFAWDIVRLGWSAPFAAPIPATSRD